MTNARLKTFWGSIRTKFLVYFVAAIALILVYAVATTYKTISDVVVDLNGQTSSSELTQIAMYLTGVHDDLTRQSDALIRSGFAESLSRPRSRLSEIYTIRALYDEVTTIISNFPYIHSVYFFNDDGRVLFISNENVQSFESLDWTAYPQLAGALKRCTSKSIQYLGGLGTDAFPHHAGTKRSEGGQPVVTAVRSMKQYQLVLNVYEERFQRAYTGVSTKPSCQIRILDRDGIVLSSRVEAELGQAYEGLRLLSTAVSGQVEDASTQKQVSWVRLPSAGVAVASEVMLTEYWGNLTRILHVLLAIIIPGFLIACLGVYLWLGRAFRPFGRLEESMRLVGTDGDAQPLPVRGTDELSRLVGNYNDMLDKLRDLRRQNEQADHEKRESDLRALRNQINPHFLFNTLSTIKWMCAMEGNQRAVGCITSLCAIVGPMFKGDEPAWPLREELRTIDHYVRIMNTRLGGVVEYREAVDETLLDISVLRFVLQPLFENSITHGFDASSGKGRIELHISRDQADMRIRVSNDGQPLTEEALCQLNGSIRTGRRTRGIGLINTHNRIVLRYGDAYGVWVEANPDGRGVSTWMKMPILSEKE